MHYEAIVTNANLLDSCFVESPNVDYCFNVLGIFNAQINNADFATKNMQSIRTLTYAYLISLELPIEYQKFIIRVSTNNKLINEKLEDFLPLTKESIKDYQNILTTTYYNLINIENARFSEKEEKIKEDTTKKILNKS